MPEIRTGVWLMLMGAFIAQGVARGRTLGLSATAVGVVVWAVASLTICAALAWRCRARGQGECVGLRLVALGTFLNVVAVLLNQGMPATSIPGVARAVGASEGFYVHVNAATILPFLGDVLVAGGNGLRFVLSVGDVLLMIGVCLVITGLMLRSARGVGSQSLRPNE